VTWWLAKASFWLGVGVLGLYALSRRPEDEEQIVHVVRYTVLDEDFPAAVGELVVRYITQWKRDPRFVLAGRREMAALRRYPSYVLSVENGERWYFQSVIILPVALDTFLDVVG